MNNVASRSSFDFQRLCDCNVPYCGAVDDGKGTIAYINSDVAVEKISNENYIYYSKRVLIKINKVTHVVRKGDSLSALAKKLGVSVQAIATTNEIQDVNMIQVGSALNIDVNIQYGYEISSTIDMNSFGDKAKAKGYNPLSETILYNILENIHNYSDSFGQSLVDNAGKSRIGNNYHLYVEKSSGRIFQGNQYVKTYGLKEFGSRMTQYTQPLKVGKVALPLAVAFEGVEIYDGWEQDGRSFGYNTQKQTVGAAYALAGATMGAAFGVWLFGVGSIPGAILGGFIGGIVGSLAGEEIGEGLFDELNQLEK